MAEREQTTAATQSPSDDIWSKCPSCKEMAFRKEVANSGGVGFDVPASLGPIEPIEPKRAEQEVAVTA